MSGYTLDWRGDAVLSDVQNALVGGMTEIGQRCVSEAMQELYKGHGVLTGTLRRSIHTAPPDYPWDADRGGSNPGNGEAVVDGDQVRITFGSGLEYAWPVHEGHGNFEGYHYLTIAVDRVRPQSPDIISRHRAKAVNG